MAVGGARGQQVLFSHPSGTYPACFTLTLTAADGLDIHYTLNGNTPTAASPLYTAPLAIDRRALSPSAIYRLRNAPDDRWYCPDSVERIVVVRAALFDSEGHRRSPVESRSYVVTSLLGREVDLPVISLCVDSTDLFDPDSGIFVPGRHYDSSYIQPFRTGNYYQRGREWERTAHLTFIDGPAAQLEQDCGVRAHGISQRNKQQKALTLYARKEYGDKRFRLPVFTWRHPQSYKRLVLRTFQASWPENEAGIQDWLCQQLAEPLRCDNLASRPVVVFLNGEYWGLYFLEEKPDKHYIEDLHGVDEDSATVITYWLAAENGDVGRWDDFYARLEAMDPADSADMAWLASSVDIGALVDYMLLQLFIANDDWPANNTRCWSSPGRPWRWIFFDGDRTLHDFDALGNITCTDPAVTYPTSPRATLLFRCLMGNTRMQLHIVERLRQLAATTFSPAATTALLDRSVATVAAELPHQSARFHTPASEVRWLYEVARIRNHLTGTANDLLQRYIDYFNLELSGGIRLEVYPNPSAGEAWLRIACEEEGVARISVWSVDGRQVFTTVAECAHGQRLVALPPLPNGHYLVTSNGSHKALKWIVLK